MNVKVFWLEPSELVEISLRRYVSREYMDGIRQPGGECPLMLGEYSYHDKSVIIERRLPLEQVAPEDRESCSIPEISGDRDYPHDDLRWPTQCDCGFEFVAHNYWQKNVSGLYKSTLDGQLYTLRDAPVGAMWDAHWMSEWWKGPDGICLVVKTPGGDWMVDNESSNCTDPARNNGGVRTHYCWLRFSANPDDITIGKEGGKTCSAGAGSILIGSYHGFLKNGYLIDC